MLYLKIVPNEFINQSRNMREISVVKEFTNNILIMGKKNSENITEKNNLKYIGLTTRPLGHLGKLNFINRTLSVLLWARKVKKLRPSVISCHDIYILFIGWLSTVGLRKKKRPILIYDSHEFEIGRNKDQKRNLLTTYIISKIEKFLMRRVAFSIMVNESIADEVKRIHKVKTDIVVVRNIPEYWELNQETISNERMKMKKNFNIPNESLMVMYHGGITFGRGIEKLLEICTHNKQIFIILLGNGDEKYIESIRKTIEEKGIENQVAFMQAVNQKDLWKYVGAVDCGVTLTPNSCTNHYLMLPNKLFENIQSLTPIIGSNFPEISKIIDGYNIGICVNPDSVEEINNALEKLRTDKQLYGKFKKNLVLAKNDLTWEKEREPLYHAYEKLFRGN